MGQDELYYEASASHGRALERLVRGYEIDPDKRLDLLQEIHCALWQSFKNFEQRCSLRTWVYRVAHNTAVSYVIRQRRIASSPWTSLADLEATPAEDDHSQTDQRMAFDRLIQLIHRLKPFDRQLMLLYLEGMDAAAISEIAGISPGNVRTQIYRIKAILKRRFHGGSQHEK